MPTEAHGGGRAAARRNIACDECKKRKVRCSAEKQCSNCLRDGKLCTYSSPVHRVPALEKYDFRDYYCRLLDLANLRIRRKIRGYEQLFDTIKRAWDQYCPQVTLQQALESLDTHSSLPDKGIASDVPSSVHASSVPSSEAARMPSVVAASPTSILSHEDHEQNNPEDFEFDESQDLGDSIDGMGILTLDPFKAGYTGPQSGIAALKVLRSLPAAYPLESDELTQVSSHPLSESGSTVSLAALIDDYFELYRKQTIRQKNNSEHVYT